MVPCAFKSRRLPINSRFFFRHLLRRTICSKNLIGYPPTFPSMGKYWKKETNIIKNIHCITLIILRIARNLLETRENFKIESHSFYHIICDRFSWGSSKKIQNGRFSKWPFFKIANSQNFFMKILWIGPWVSI